MIGWGRKGRVENARATAGGRRWAPPTPTRPAISVRNANGGLVYTHLSQIVLTLRELVTRRSSARAAVINVSSTKLRTRMAPPQSIVPLALGPGSMLGLFITGKHKRAAA